MTARAVVVVLATALVAGCGDSDRPKIVGASPTGQRPFAPVDSTTLFNSIARVFIAKYNAGTPPGRFTLASEIVSHCDDGKADTQTCEMRIALPVISDEAWLYDAKLTNGACWVARTRDRYGANQSIVDAYRNRDTFAPSAAALRRVIRESDRLHVLRGCASNVPRAAAGSAPEVFVAAFAKQNVQRERPGAQKATSCRYLGKQEIALAPDSWDFDCTTTLASGKRYLDKLACFDAPPYDSLDPCVEASGYPKRPPRPLP